jgi:hypothetical protein
MLQAVASLTITILMTLDVSFTLLESSITLIEKNYGTHDDHHITIKIFYSIGHRFHLESHSFMLLLIFVIVANVTKLFTKNFDQN